MRLAVATVTLATRGCGKLKSDDGQAAATQSVLHLTIGPTTGVTDIRFVIAPVDCGTGAGARAAIDVAKPLDSLSVPDSIPELGDHPLDSGSMHAFADDFEVVHAGCYDVSTQPYYMGALACHEAHKKRVRVSEGQTTEVFLVNQCDGPTPGGLDVISALNHPPVLTDVSFDKSKLVLTCGAQVICATAYDPEKDPLRFVWTPAGGPTVAGPFDVRAATNADGSITQCARFVPSGPGKVTLSVTVYDLLHNNTAMRAPETFEQWLADQGYPGSSHTTLDFFFYAEGGPRSPVPEICDDGIDDDCDGLVDAADPDCASIPAGGCDAGERPFCDRPIDVMLLEDLTGSFADDLVTVNGVSSTLANDLLSSNAGTLIGVASFKDKPFVPFGEPGSYVYKLELPLTNTAGSFVSTLANLSAAGGGDLAEAQVEALNLLSQDDAAGFRPSFPHLVVVATDAPPHVAPECVALGLCSGPNNGDGVADPSDDYPSLAQLEATLNARQITPIFAVAGGNDSFYQSIVDDLHRGRVITLADDSHTLENAIFAGLPACHCAAR
ncbi:MAG TPA: hypothetical protein VGK52_08695 [Polyangia bacterium]